MPILIKEFDAATDEMWSFRDRLIPWLEDNVGVRINYDHALKGIAPGGLENLKSTYQKVRGCLWSRDKHIVSLTHYWGDSWQVFIAYSMLDERQEFIVELDNEIIAIQCKLAVL
jgi:hypothetical protein